LQGEHVVLDAVEARHARVRRLTPGGNVIVFDGVGNSRLATVQRVSRQAVELRLLQALPFRSGESPLEVTLGLALLKAERLEYVIEKATELGVSRILPFASRYSLGRPSVARRSRWKHIAVSAAKQCARTVVPPIEEPVRFVEVLREPAPCRVLLWEGAEPEQAADLARIHPVPARVTLLIGPEGGFAADEVDAARAAGWRLISLGPRILRADTAAVAAVAVCQNLWGDLHGCDKEGR